MLQLSPRETERRERQRLISMEQLRTEKGISYSRAHLHRLIKAKVFPAPIKLGENRNAWVEAEVDAWIDARIAQREAA